MQPLNPDQMKGMTVLRTKTTTCEVAEAAAAGVESKMLGSKYDDEEEEEEDARREEAGAERGAADDPWSKEADYY